MPGLKKNNELSISVIYKTFSHVTGCLYFNVIYRPRHACASTLEYISVHFYVLYSEIKISGDKAKLNVIKNVKRRKLCFMMF